MGWLENSVIYSFDYIKIMVSLWRCYGGLICGSVYFVFLQYFHFYP